MLYFSSEVYGDVYSFTMLFGLKLGTLTSIDLYIKI